MWGMDTFALDNACDLVGSQTKLAKLLGIRSPSISEWRRRQRVPAERCIAIEQATGGKITRYDLRPDVFGAAPAALREAG